MNTSRLVLQTSRLIVSTLTRSQRGRQTLHTMKRVSASLQHSSVHGKQAPATFATTFHRLNTQQRQMTTATATRTATKRSPFYDNSAVSYPYVFVFIGPPGVGKGTFTAKLSEEWGIPIICTGDIIREEIANQTELGMKVQSTIAKGELLPDALSSEITFNKLSTLHRSGTSSVYILDGFPRTVGQYKIFEEKWQKPIDCIVNLVQPDEALLQLATGRRVCSNTGCQRNYNVSEVDLPQYHIHLPALRPKEDNVCDSCGHHLTQRADDRKEIAAHRLQVFHKNTEPLVRFFQTRRSSNLVTFNVRQGVADYNRLKSTLAEFLEEQVLQVQQPICQE